MPAAYTKGLHEVADGVHAYLQPDGGWGWSNAGLISGEGASTLIDTLFDLRLTQEMLDVMGPITKVRPITALVNTHANGDHCYGNQLVAGGSVDVIATNAAAAEMDEAPPAAMAGMMAMADDLPPELGDFLRHAFGPFRFDDIEPTAPNRTFSDTESITVGGRRIELYEVGPAHTAGDLLAWLPDASVVFTGDILFIHGTPIIWAGPVANWITACDRIVDLSPAVIVPGHGPLTDAEGVRAVRDYLRFIDDGTRVRHEAGMAPLDAALDLDAEVDNTPYGVWGDRERIIVNVQTLWTTLEPGYARPGIAELMGGMAHYAATHRR